MKKAFATLFFLTVLLAANSAVAPIWINHSRVRGDQQIMSNFKEWAEDVQQQIGQVKQKKYAMFIIPMNDKAYGTRSGHYMNFELKASINDFDASLSRSERCQFYAHSAHANEFVMHNDKIHLFVNHGGPDQRSYVRISNTVEELLTYAPSDLIAIVDVALMTNERPDHSWCSSENDNLMWTYVRSTDIDREKDVDTDNYLWRPIAPVKWMSELPTWAQ